MAKIHPRSEFQNRPRAEFLAICSRGGKARAAQIDRAWYAEFGRKGAKALWERWRANPRIFHCEVCGIAGTTISPLTRFCKPCLTERRRRVIHPRASLRHRHKKVAFLRNVKLQGCVDCGERDPVVLDFHHLHGKTFNINRAYQCSIKRILEELAKCVLLCANCHRRREYRKRNGINADSGTQPMVPPSINTFRLYQRKPVPGLQQLDSPDPEPAE